MDRSDAQYAIDFDKRLDVRDPELRFQDTSFIWLGSPNSDL